MCKNIIFDKNLAKLIVKYYRKYNSNNSPEHILCDLNCSLEKTTFFPWCNTAEGYEFWKGVCVKLSNHEKLCNFLLESYFISYNFINLKNYVE